VRVARFQFFKRLRVRVARFQFFKRLRVRVARLQFFKRLRVRVARFLESSFLLLCPRCSAGRRLFLAIHAAAGALPTIA